MSCTARTRMVKAAIPILLLAELGVVLTNRRMSTSSPATGL